MGMRAEILAIGPFRREVRGVNGAVQVANHLEYPADCYRHALEGGIVFNELLQCNTSQGSEDLAAAFGLQSSDSGLGSHEIDADQILSDPDWETSLQDHPAIDDTRKSIADLKALARVPGWRFFYRPNG